MLYFFMSLLYYFSMKNKKLFYTFLSISVFVFFMIIFFSLANKEKSTSQSSEFITNVVKPFVPETPKDDTVKPFYLTDQFSLFIRKSVGHFSLFVVFSFFVNLTFLETTLSYVKSFSFSSLIGVFTASLSELLQLIPNGREAKIQDVLLDSSGYVLCVLIFALVIYLRTRKKRRVE